MSSAAPSACPPRPELFLRISAVGHRKLADPAAVARGCDAAFALISAAFDRVSAEARRRAPIFADTPPRLVLVDALAAGADEIAAERFLASPGSAMRSLEVALPFAEAHARRLALADGATAFDALLARADRVFEIDDFVPTGDNDASHDPPEDRRRDLRHVAVADILVRQADLLLAVWNGDPALGPGGTANTVSAALREGVPVLRIDPADGALTLLAPREPYGDLLTTRVHPDWRDDPDARLALLTGVITRIVAGPWPSSPSDDHGAHGHGHAGTPQPRRIERYFGGAHHPGEPAPKTVRAGMYDWMLRASGAKVGLQPPPGPTDDPLADRRAIEAFRERKASEPTLAARFRIAPTQQTDFLAGDLHGFEVPALPHLRERALQAWAHADAAATALGHDYRSTYVSTFVIGSIAVLIGLLGLLSKDKWVFVLFEIVVLSMAIRIFVRARRQHVHERWIDARHLAEQFRPGWLLARLGLGGRRVLRDGAPWTAWAVQTHLGAIGLPRLRLDAGALRAIARDVAGSIVIDQLHYHRRNAERMRRLHEALERGGFLALAITPAIGLAFILHDQGSQAGGLFLLPAVVGFAGVAIVLMTDLARASLARDFFFAGGYALSCAALLFATVPDAKATATILLAGLPALAAALAGIRYHGDYERFSKRSVETARELERIGLILCDYRTRAEPSFLELRDILIDLERVMMSDIQDWRFVYAERPSPEP